MKWISVKDKLPRMHTEVLVRLSNSEITGAWYDDKEWITMGVEPVNNEHTDECVFESPISEWMYIPAEMKED